MDEGLFSATGYTSEWDYPLGEKCGYSSLDAAMNVCEQDYVALCTQFLRLYNPRTHIVVSREAGERVAKIIEYDVCGRENCKCGELAAEIRAALEGEK